MFDLTFLICTRNGERTIEQCISHIANQREVDHTHLELIVVDNGSSDRTPEIVEGLSARLSIRTIFLRETREGKLNAFLRGLAAAAAPIVSVVDDDNLICDTYAVSVIAFFDQYPTLGMVGSYNRYYGAPPPPWFHIMKGRYACSEPFLHQPSQLDAHRRHSSFGVIAGAGSAFRKAPLQEAITNGFVFLNDTFRGQSLSVTGEDTELCYLFRHLGYSFGSDSRITLQHHLHPSRLDWNYAKRLAHSIGAGGLAVDLMIHFSNPSDSFSHQLKATWWWLGFRHVKRLSVLFPKVLFLLGSNQRHNVLWIQWAEEVGAIERAFRERKRIAAHIRLTKQTLWLKMGNRSAIAPAPATGANVNLRVHQNKTDC